MDESTVIQETRLWIEEGLQSGAETEPVLAAALAAALVAYRRHVGPRSGLTSPTGTHSNWRMMARLEQMVPPTHHRPGGRG